MILLYKHKTKPHKIHKHLFSQPSITTYCGKFIHNISKRLKRFLITVCGTSEILCGEEKNHYCK